MLPIPFMSDDAASVAPQWCKGILSDHAWTPESPPGSAGGITAGFFVKNGSVRAYAKPTRLGTAQMGPGHVKNAVAAHEKIAADLANTLGLPVPPVLLWDRKGGKPGTPRHCCLSLVPFHPFYTWAQVLHLQGAPKRILPEIAAAASAMHVFDTWIDNRDRVNHGNLIVGEDAAGVHCAYIDFAQSMSFGWGEGPPHDIRTPVHRYPGAAPLRIDSVQATLAAIEALPEEEIRAAVNRIPGGFVSAERRSCIANGLVLRQAKLRSVLTDAHGVSL